MKILLFLLIFGFWEISRADGIYEEFIQKARIHEEEIKKDGMSYMVGGSLGLVSSVYFGITTKDVLPKLGFTFMQTLSAGAIAYGAKNYFVGDAFTEEAKALQQLQTELARTPGMSPQNKKWLLDQTTRNSIARVRQQQKRTRKIRGTVELLTAGTSISTIVFSENHDAAGTAALGFIALITTLAGASDLLSEPDSLSWVQLYANHQSDRLELAVAFRY